MSGNAFCPFHVWKRSGFLGGGGGGSFFFPAGQCVSLSLPSCPTAEIINKLSFCREEVAETENLKPASCQWLPWPSMALAKGQGRWWPRPTQRDCGCSTLHIQGKITAPGTSSLLSLMPTRSKAVCSSPQRLSKLSFKCSSPCIFLISLPPHGFSFKNQIFF